MQASLFSLMLCIAAISGSAAAADLDYKDALMKSILFFEGQRSGKLPKTQRVKWRADSGLSDGSLARVNLRGGYYDAGDNVKFGWPMSFTVSLLSWAAVQYKQTLAEAHQLEHLLEAISWGTDFILRANTGPTTLWTQVGDGNSDHQCWERPEDMDTPRTLVVVNASSPGTEPAADAAAALASASIVFEKENSEYSAKLLRHSVQLFKFANKYRASYQASCPFYCSYSGYQDELLWAATWLYKATGKPSYLKFLVENHAMSGIVSEFSWDNKFAGAQILLAQEFLLNNQTSLSPYKSDADAFVCVVLPNTGRTQIRTTPAGLIYIRDSSNLQYVNSASMALLAYSDVLAMAKAHVQCGETMNVTAAQMKDFAEKQVQYLLGKNPMSTSYMVGYGDKYPQQVHHRGASIPSIGALPAKVGCGDGYSHWYNRDAPNPNVHVGAVVGGPDQNDGFTDSRSSYSHLEPATYINAALVGALASLIQAEASPQSRISAAGSANADVAFIS